MSSYGEAASVFQLGLWPECGSADGIFRVSADARCLTKHLAEEVNKIDPSMTFGERELIVVRHYVRYGFPAMRNARPLGLAIAGLFAAALLLSLIGLVLSAVDAHGHLSNWLVVLFSAFALIGCPVAGTVYSFLMSYGERQIILRLDQTAVEHFIDPIRQSLIMRKLGDEMKDLTNQIKEETAELNYRTAQQELRTAWREFKQEVRNRFEEVWSVFRR